MTGKREVSALFPASCIPALAAFQGTSACEPPLWGADLLGVWAEAHPEHDGRVRLVAFDGSNLLVLSVAGRCQGGPFVFHVPPELVELCHKKPPVGFWAEGSSVSVPPPAWMQPGAVLLLGARHDPDPHRLTHLWAHVGPKEPCPENPELGLGCVDVGFNELASHKRYLPHQLDRIGSLETSPLIEGTVSPAAIRKLAALGELGGPMEVGQAETFQIWKFGDHWAATCFADLEKIRGNGDADAS